ncbi:MAG: hypothetical protein ACR2HP_17420 [Ilumatobacteraceae bacterium]
MALAGRLELAIPDEAGELLLAATLSARDTDGQPVSATRRAAARIVPA